MTKYQLKDGAYYDMHPNKTKTCLNVLAEF